MGGASQQDDAGATPDESGREVRDSSCLPSGPAGSSDISVAGDLIEQIGAEIERRLEARLAALGLAGAATTVTAPAYPGEATVGATEARREAGQAPGASAARRRLAGVVASPWQSLWIGIVIGSAVTGAAALTQGVRISTDVNQELGGPPNYFVNASWDIAEALAGAWVLLLVVYLGQLLADHAREHRR